MQRGIVRLRCALVAAWEDDLRALRQDTFELGGGRQALVFMQRFYGLIAGLRPQIQGAWGQGAHVHVVDASEVGGPGPRVSQSRIKLHNRGDRVTAELFTYVDGASLSNPGAGLDREIALAGVAPLAAVTELYRLAVDFLQVALNVDLELRGSSWLYEHVAAGQFVATGRWPTAADVYRRTAREFAVAGSFESLLASVAPATEADGSSIDRAEMRLSIEQLQRYPETQLDMENFMRVVQLAVAADPDDRRVTSDQVREQLGVDELAITKLGRLLAGASDVVREAEFSPDFGSWSFLPSYNVHLFRRGRSVEDFLALQRTLAPPAAVDAPAGAAPASAVLKIENGAALPDGIVTFMMTDVVESTLLWLQSRGSMYQAMQRHDQLLASAIEANGGVVLKERGEGDSFFAVFQRATDAVVAAIEVQQAIQAEEWPEGVVLAVRVAILTGEADAADRDYRSPAVNRCAKLRRRAVGNQILVSETTYSIVADILREDIRLVSVGKRLLEGHVRAEEIYVVQHPSVQLELDVASDDIFPSLSVLPGLEQQAEPGLA